MDLIDLIKSKEKVETSEFQHIPAFSKISRFGLRNIIILFSQK